MSEPGKEDLTQLLLESRAALDQSKSVTEVLSESESEMKSANEKITTAEQEAKAKNIAKMGSDRTAIALTIIGTYAVATLVIVGYVAFGFPKCAGADAQICLEARDKQADVLLDSLTTAILPIVTLMLGFYFGVEKSSGGGRDKA